MSKIKASANGLYAIKYTGERLISTAKYLQPMRVENIARYRFFTKQISTGYILDYGCGAGEGAYFLSTKNNFHVIGVDNSYNVINYANYLYNNENLHFACCDILYPCIRNQFFDGIVSVEVIEHIKNSNQFLQKIISLLKSDGVFMLTTPNQKLSSPTTGSLWPEHVHEYNISELNVLLKDYFEEVSLWGEIIPIFEGNKLRQFVRNISPQVKPLLPRWMRVRALPFLFWVIKPDLKIEDVVFTSSDIDKCSTIVAICKKPKVL